MAERAHVEAIACEIKGALSVALNPLSVQTDRASAYQVIEEFKQSSPLCSDVGFYLFTNQTEPEIRKCGIQFVENFIKLHWDTLDVDKKILYKQRAVELIQATSFSEPVYVKESLVKVVVEVIKRSWPQEWESLFQDLSQLQALGDAQLEIVLIILMRLSEDIDGLDENLTTARKNEMRQTLNNNMSDLFHFFIDTLQNQVMKLKEAISPESVRIAEASIYTITAFASWVNLIHLLAKDKILLQVLFWLLEVKKLKLHASTCLSLVFGRKFQPDKKQELMIILSEDVLTVVQKAASSCLDAARHNEDDYRFFKNVVEMMCNFGKIQLGTLWGDEKGFQERPNCFDLYLKLMLEFSKHDSMLVGMMTTKLWFTFLSHKSIQKDEIFLAVLPEVLECLHQKLAKIGNPLLADQPASSYSVMDFDDVDEYNEAFGASDGNSEESIKMSDVLKEKGTSQDVDVKNQENETSQDVNVKNQIIPFSCGTPPIFVLVEVRNFTLATIKSITELSSLVVLKHCLSKMKEATEILPPNVNAWLEKKILLSHHYIKWDALAHYAKNGFSPVFFKQVKTLTVENINMCNEVLKSLVNYQCEVPLFIQQVMACMEALFPIFKSSQENLLATMQMLIQMIGLDIKQDRTVNQQIRLKRHSCAAFSKLCKEIPDILATIFNDLEVHFGEVFQKDLLSNNEKGVLLEGLLAVCVHVQDVEMKQNFMSKMFSYAKAVLTREDIKVSLEDSSKFVSFLGLDAVKENDLIVARRKELLLALYMCQAASRALVVKDFQQDLNKHPWVQPMIGILPSILELARQYSLLWTVQNKFSEVNKDVLLQSSYETQGGKVTATKEDVDLKPNQAQNTIINIHETIYTTLSHYGTCVGPTLYSLAGLSDVMIEKLIKNWSHLPSYKLRKVCRSLKLFVSSCPVQYYDSMIGPLISAAITTLFQKLCQEWKRVKDLVALKTASKESTDSDDDEDGEGNVESTEIIEERNLHNFSREFIDTLASFCQYNKEKDKPNSDGTQPTIGALGEFLLSYEATNLSIIMTLFTALTWPDTSTVNRIYNIVKAIVNQLFTPSNPVNPEIPNQMLLLTLQGLQVHGSDASGQAALTNIALQLYMNLREQYPSLVQIMMMVPSCTQEELQKFDLDVFASTEPLNDSQRRKRFKKLIEGALGALLIQMLHRKIMLSEDVDVEIQKTVSELHKNSKKIKDLPALAPRVKKENRSVLDDTTIGNNVNSDLCNFFGEEM